MTTEREQLQAEANAREQARFAPPTAEEQALFEAATRREWARHAGTQAQEAAVPDDTWEWTDADTQALDAADADTQAFVDAEAEAVWELQHGATWWREATC
ncbi:hypothetical protein [Nocardioides sp.]|uniref:hypothetical protein n=1 Tax=Nocardioides sp. TaxID=35761 RepID=UPI0027364B89|nr:hypothetical protein [Nocardioides sp.]MDP3893453.1 hypothetical protein [Nocardioides sp.]